MSASATLAAIAVLLPLALSGCGAPEPAPTPAVQYVTAPHPANVSVKQPCVGFVGSADMTGLGVQVADQPYKSVSVFDNAARLGVPGNAAAIVLDLWWEGGVTTGIRSHVTGPGGFEALSDPQEAATEEAPLRLRIDAPEEGDWRWEGLADPIAAGVVLHFNYGLYYDSPESLSFFCNGSGTQSGG